MARLPVPQGDDDVWGVILNDFLSVSHESDGTLKAHAHTAADISDFSTVTDARITTQKGAASGIASLDATTKVPITQLPTGTTSTTVSLGSHTHSAATTAATGFMSAADKTKLDGIATSANNYIHPIGDGSLHVPVTGTTNNGKILKAGAAAGSISWGTLSASDVGAAASGHSHDDRYYTESEIDSLIKAKIISYQTITEWAAYPDGLSMFSIDNQTDWPTTMSTVVTNKISSSRTSQWLYSSASGAPPRYRTYHSSYGWSAWQEMATTDHVHDSLSSGENLIVNGDGNLGLTGWSAAGATLDSSDCPEGTYASVAVPSTTTSSFGVGGLRAVRPNTKYLVEMWAKADVANSRFYLQIMGYNQAGTYTSGYVSPTYQPGNQVMSMVWTKYTTEITTGASCYFIRPTIYPNHANGTATTTQRFGALSVRRILSIAEGGTGTSTASAALTSLGAAAISHNHSASDISDFSAAADARIAAQKGAANGLATLDSNSKILASQIPSSATSYASRLIGEIMPWPSGTIPGGWLLCNGSLISRTTYADLYAVLGTAYGAGDGSTTFGLPDLRGRSPMGYDSTQAEFNTMGEKGGAKTHTLLTSEMPSHTHPIVRSATGNAQTHVAAYGVSETAGSNRWTLADGTAGLVTSATGGGGAHNNLQPYQVTNWIIKATYYSSEVAPTSHTHAIADITNLQSTLDSKLSKTSVLLTTQDLDTLTTPGWYYQNTEGVGDNYPNISTGLFDPTSKKGVLEVSVAGTNIHQRFTLESTWKPVIYTRNRVSGTWTGWTAQSLVGHTHTPAEIGATVYSDTNITYTANYKKTTNATRYPLELSMTAEGRYRFTGTLTNNVTITGFSINIQYIYGKVPTDFIPTRDVCGIGMMNLPGIGVDFINFIVRGSAAGTSYQGVPGDLILQTVQQTRTGLNLAAGTIIWQLPILEWDPATVIMM